MNTRIGFVGLGIMGSQMASHLAKAQYPLTVLDTDSAKIDALIAKHPNTKAATTPKQLAAQSDVVITMLPDGSYVQQVATGPDGLIEGFAEGALLIDTSSCEPWLTRETAAALATKNVQMVDAATSGAEMGAKAADLVFMIGGETAAVSRAREILSVMGNKTFHLGPVSSGHAMKSINNMITAMTLVATAEGLVLGKKLGLDPNVMTDVLNVSTGMSWISQTHIKQRITNRAFDDAFRLALMHKDVRIALSLAADSQLELPFSELGSSIYKKADDHAPAGSSISEVVRWVEHTTGVDIEP